MKQKKNEGKLIVFFTTKEGRCYVEAVTDTEEFFANHPVNTLSEWTIQSYEFLEKMFQDTSFSADFIPDTKKFSATINEEDCTISHELFERLVHVGIIGADDIRGHNVGKSDYSKYTIQPWSVILDHNLNYWEGDIIKRTLRHKEGENRITDLEKIKHICDELIRQEKNKR